MKTISTLPESREIPTLETERLRLRAFRAGDIDAYVELNADPEGDRYTGGGAPWDPQRCWRHMAFLVGHWQLGGAGTWAVELRESGEMIGNLGFFGPEGWHGFELAWKLQRTHWGNGYASEGARAALAYAFAVRRRDLVISLIHPENSASIRVAERIGETLRGRVDHQGMELLCYGIDRASHEARLASKFAKPTAPVPARRRKVDAPFLAERA